MARCPFCNAILPDEFVERAGASLMGKKSGAAKARTRTQAQAAAQVRWGRQKRETDPEKRRIATNEYHRQWRQKNPDKCREYSRRKREKNPERWREYYRRWQEKNRRRKGVHVELKFPED